MKLCRYRFVSLGGSLDFVSALSLPPKFPLDRLGVSFGFPLVFDLRHYCRASKGILEFERRE